MDIEECNDDIKQQFSFPDNSSQILTFNCSFLVFLRLFLRMLNFPSAPAADRENCFTAVDNATLETDACNSLAADKRQLWTVAGV